MSATKSLNMSFAAGEVSPLLHGRLDLVPYQTGLALCKNFVTLAQGPAKFRPGLQFHQYGAAGYGRLIPFVYADDQAYWVEFSAAGFLRIHTVGGTLLDSVSGPYTVRDISRAAPAIIKFDVGQLADGDDVHLTVTGMAEVSGRWYRLDFQSTDGTYDYFVLGTPTMPGGIDSSAYTAFAAGTASIPMALAHPYSVDELPLLRYAQNADVLTVCSDANEVRALRRTGPNTWSFTVDTFAPGVASPGSLSATASGSGGTPVTHYYVVTAVVTDGSANAESLAYGPASASVDLSVAGNKITLASGTPAAGTRHNYFKALNGLYGFIGQGGGSFEDKNIVPNLSISPPEYGPSLNGAGEYPRAVGYFQQRKVFAGSVNKPQTIWMTRNGTELDMTYTVPSRDDNALSFGIASRDAQTIQHVVPLRDLLVLTRGGVWRVSARGNSALSPSTATVDLSAYVGASHVQPAVSDSAVLYAFARGGRIGEIRYTDSSADYEVSDVCLLAPHLFDGYSITDMALMQTPNKLLWVLRSDGTLLSMSYQPEHKVLAWHQHDVGGSVRSICVVPSTLAATQSEDLLIAFVDRRVADGEAGSSYQSIEILSGFGDYPIDHRSAYWVAPDNLALTRAIHADSALVYEGAPADRIIGMHHLEGRPVSVVSDGAVHPPLTVTNGELLLEAPASRVVIGLPYVGRVKTLPLAIEGERAEGQGVLKSVSRAYVRVLNSSGIFAGPDFDHLDELKARTDEPYGVAPDWKSGEFEITISPLWGRSGEICIEQRAPMPLALLGLTLDVEIGG